MKTILLLTLGILAMASPLTCQDGGTPEYNSVANLEFVTIGGWGRYDSLSYDGSQMVFYFKQHIGNKEGSFNIPLTESDKVDLDQMIGKLDSKNVEIDQTDECTTLPSDGSESNLSIKTDNASVKINRICEKSSYSDHLDTKSVLKKLNAYRDTGYDLIEAD
jgi:hypothetical protein